VIGDRYLATGDGYLAAGENQSSQNFTKAEKIVVFKNLKSQISNLKSGFQWPVRRRRLACLNARGAINSSM
jgi:hypothetical protein